LLDAIEGCDCYALCGLRWANRASRHHDDTCKKNARGK
jgi:hypothetical protein